MFRSHRMIALLVVAALVTVGCAGAANGPRVHIPAVVAGTRGVVVDTDMGLDDVLALLYLGSRPDVTIRAVTVEGDGLAHCAPGVRNARALLALTGHAGTLVACGAVHPLRGANAFPDEWRASADDLYGLQVPAPSGTAATLPAADLLLRTLDGRTALLTLGPFTNVAEALRDDPALAARIPTVVSMAGALDVPGNAPGSIAEYNVWVDPVAASEALAALPVTLVPLDATNAVPFTSFFVDALRRNRATAVARAVYRLVGDDPYLVSGAYFFWDPLAAGLLTEPALATYRDRALLVATSHDAAAGWMADDRRGSAARVATRVDALGFERAYLSAIAGTAVTDVRPAPDLVITFDGHAATLSSRGALTPGPAVVRFRNRTARDATAVLAAFGPAAAYRDLLSMIGAPGSTVTAAPDGFRPVGTVNAAAGTNGWLAVTLRGPNLAAVAGFPEVDALRAWPAGWLPVAG